MPAGEISYCSYHTGFEVFSHIICAKIPRVAAPKCAYAHFVCIAKRVTGHGVNSNINKPSVY